MKRHASAIWNGNLKEGMGTLSTESRALSSTPYSFTTRFVEGVTGTNPEELVGAAHAGCFSMALSGELQGRQLSPQVIQTQAQVTLDRDPQGWSVRAVHLEVTARVPGATESQLKEAAEAAKKGCPISRLLKAEITMNARLESAENRAQSEMNY